MILSLLCSIINNSNAADDYNSVFILVVKKVDILTTVSSIVLKELFENVNMRNKIILEIKLNMINTIQSNY